MKRNNGVVHDRSRDHTGFFRLKFLKYLISILFLHPAVTFGQEYSLYTVFDDFEIIAPVTPTEIIKNTMYGSKDEGRGIGIIITKGPSGLEFDIGEYDPAIKKMLDDSIIQGEKILGDMVTRFSSNFDKENNKYITTYFVAPK